MTFASRGDTSDVDVSFNYAGFYQCVRCSLVKDDEDYRTMTARAMAEHLDAHVTAGHKIPREGLLALKAMRE